MLSNAKCIIIKNASFTIIYVVTNERAGLIKTILISKTAFTIWLEIVVPLTYLILRISTILLIDLLNKTLIP